MRTALLPALGTVEVHFNFRTRAPLKILKTSPIFSKIFHKLQDHEQKYPEQQTNAPSFLVQRIARSPASPSAHAFLPATFLDIALSALQWIPRGTLFDPEFMADALKGQNFSHWAPLRRFNLIWDQLELVDNLSDPSEVEELPQNARNRARRVRKEECNRPDQAPSHFTTDRVSVPTSVEVLSVEEMEAVILELDGNDEDVLSIILDG